MRKIKSFGKQSRRYLWRIFLFWKLKHFRFEKLFDQRAKDLSRRIERIHSQHRVFVEEKNSSETTTEGMIVVCDKNDYITTGPANVNAYIARDFSRRLKRNNEKNDILCMP